MSGAAVRVQIREQAYAYAASLVLEVGLSVVMPIHGPWRARARET